MAELLEAFDVERSGLFEALGHFEVVWDRFRERQTLHVEGSDLSDSMIATELALVRNELERTLFTIGVFGLIKRGKSTLLNSLIGREVSSMHVTPETAVPVYVSYAKTPGAAVHFADGSTRHVAVEEVSQFTSQKHNPANELGVTYVEQGVPVPFLRNGTRLIDTPGLDDAAADDVYTERTLQELDVCDAGIVVFLSPPTVGATEMGFLEEVVSRDLKKTFLVCNMYPQHFHDKQTRRDVLNYVGGRIVEASRRAGQRGEVRVYPVCAYEAWQSRVHEDVDMWKRSGADRLMRDLEGFLADVAGKQVLVDAVERIEKAAAMAKNEVRIRQQLLNDADQLETLYVQVDQRIRELEDLVGGTLAVSLQQVEPLRLQVRQMMLAPFSDAQAQVDELETVDEIEQFGQQFKRRVEVASEEAGRRFQSGFEAIISDLRDRLESQLQDVVSDIVPNLPPIRLSASGMLVTPDQLQTLRAGARSAKKTERTSALAGGIGGGAATLAALGTSAVLLSPLGLLAGALAGWKLSSAVLGRRRLEQARESVMERLDEISARLTRDFDRQVETVISAVKDSVERRRRGFASELYEQFDLVKAISHDPDVMEQQRIEAERFSQAFDACANRARKVVESSVY